MRNRKTTYIFLLALLVLASILAGVIFVQKSRELKIIFLDVGQGDAILIEQGSKQILIDGGPSGQALLEKLGKLVPFWDRNIEMIIVTHPDADHITGLVDVMQNYNIGIVMQTNGTSDSQIFKKFEDLIRMKKIETIEAQRGEKINLAENTEIEILNPSLETPISAEDTNASSVVARLIFGENTFLFTGDLPVEQEAELINKNINLAAKVLKIAHHGSKYSTSREFLQAVNSEDAVISVGKNNRYGHPAAETIERLKNKSIRILRTDEMGDIEYACANPVAKCTVVAN
ncbi:MAG: ComEC/Rec2 family competence protein [Parcubacteria group bacterium]|jgi:competence protein ComEC